MRWRGGAEFNAARDHRWLLWRERAELFDPEDRTTVCWVMLNPSTADESADDPTMRRVLHFSARAKFRRVRVVNLFSRISPDPRVLRGEQGAMEPEALAVLTRETQAADSVVCAWGSLPFRWAADRRREVLSLIGRRDLQCLGLTRRGEPVHPLYLRKDTNFESFNPE